MIKTEKIIRKYIEAELDFDKEIILNSVLVGVWEADILVIDGMGFSHEFEVKTSRGAFYSEIKQDSPHIKHDVTAITKNDKTNPNEYTFNTYSIIIPKDSVKSYEIPEHVGLIYYHTDNDTKEVVFTTERMPKMLHNESFWKTFDKSAFMRTLCRRFFYKDF